MSVRLVRVRDRVRVSLFCLPLLLIPALSTPARSAGPSVDTTSQCASAYENAQLLRQRGKLLAAREQVGVCAREQCPEVARRDCMHWAEELGREIPSVVVVGRDDADRDVPVERVVVDGAPRPEVASGRPFELDPGAHVFRLERAGAAPVERTVTVYQGERDRVLRILLPAQPAAPAPAPAAAPSASAAPPPAQVLSPGDRPSYALPVVVAGLSVASFAASAYLGLTGRQELSDLRSSCAPSCSDAQVDPVKTRLTLSDATLGVGLVGSALATYLFVRAASERSSVSAVSATPSPRARLELTPTRDGALAVIGGRF